MKFPFQIRAIIVTILATGGLLTVLAQPPPHPGDTDTDELFLQLLILRGAVLEVTGRLPAQLVITPEDAKNPFKELGELVLTVFSLTDYRVNLKLEAEGLPSSAFAAWVSEVRGPVNRIHAPLPSPLPADGQELPLFSGSNNVGTPTQVTVRLRLDLRKVPVPLPPEADVRILLLLEELGGG
jgi:hypothetical protein